MPPALRKPLDHTLVRYLLAGIANTLVGLGVIYFCLYALGWASAPANLLGYGIGIVFSFFMNKRWTFGHSGSSLPAFLRFAAVLGVAYLANLFTVLEMERELHLNRYLAQAAGVPSYTLVGYFGSRFFAFSKHNLGVQNDRA